MRQLKSAQLGNRQWWGECKEAAHVVRRLRVTSTVQVIMGLKEDIERYKVRLPTKEFHDLLTAHQ